MITDNTWLLEIVNGYRLELASQPFQDHLPKGDPRDWLKLEAEVEKLHQKSAIKEVEPRADRLFPVPKKDGASRPVVNLKPLNRFILKKHFKMENVSMVRELLREGDWMTSIDLKDAFLSVPIHQPHRTSNGRRRDSTFSAYLSASPVLPAYSQS